MALTITIPGAVETTTGSTAPAVLTVGVGSPGVGVPSGGTTGQVLQKLSGVSYDTGWLTLPADFITSVTSPLAVTSGDLTVDLSAYSTTAQAGALYYPLSGNPSGFLTSVPPPTLTNLTSDISWDGSANIGRLLIAGVNDIGGGNTEGRLNFQSGVPSQPYTGDFWFNGTDFFYQSGGTKTIASQTYVNAQGFITSSALAPYAPLAGATFTGKVNLATLGVATPSINLGGQCDPAPASAANGDIWISNATAPKLTYRMGGVNYNLPVLNQFNTFTNQMVIDTTSSTTAALRITQRGAGNAIEVEDSTTPDATKFVVDQFGKVGVGTAPDATAAIKVDANGISFNGLVFNPTATAAHTGGSDTLDLLVTINGTNYRLGLRPA